MPENERFISCPASLSGLEEAVRLSNSKTRPPRKIRANLREAVESTLSLFRVQASQKKVELAYFMDENVPEYIESDSGRLPQVLLRHLQGSGPLSD